MATAEFVVKVTAPGAPTLTVPGEPVEVESSGGSGVEVDYASQVSANDEIDGPLTPACDHPSGSIFPLGDTTVKCSATNSAGITGESTFIVRVTSAPPAEVTVTPDPEKFIAAQDMIKVEGQVNARLDAGNSVQLTFYDNVGTVFASSSAELDEDGSFSQTVDKQIPLEGYAFGDWKVVAEYDNVESQPAIFKVLKKGITQLVVPTSPVTIQAEGDNGAIANYAQTISATDTEEGKLVPTCSPASGTPFPIGETIVNCSVTTAAGNHVEKSFTVTVARGGIDPLMMYGIIGAVAAAAIVGGVVAVAKMRKQKKDVNIP
jgi:hypothetical protein